MHSSTQCIVRAYHSVQATLTDHCVSILFSSTYPYKFLVAVKVNPKRGYDYDTAQAQQVTGFTICLSCHHLFFSHCHWYSFIFPTILSIHVQIFGFAVMTRVNTFPISPEWWTECCWTWCFGGIICLVFFPIHTYIHILSLSLITICSFFLLFDLIEGYVIPTILLVFLFYFPSVPVNTWWIRPHFGIYCFSNPA